MLHSYEGAALRASCVCDAKAHGPSCGLVCPAATNDELALELDCAGRGECVVAEDESAISCACDDGWAGPACNTAVNATASKGAAPATAATSAFAAALAVLAGLLLPSESPATA